MVVLLSPGQKRLLAQKEGVAKRACTNEAGGAWQKRLKGVAQDQSNEVKLQSAMIDKISDNMDHATDHLNEVPLSLTAVIFFIFFFSFFFHCGKDYGCEGSDSWELLVLPCR